MIRRRAPSSRRPTLLPLLLLLAFAALTACASASVKAPSLHSAEPFQPRPTVAWVQDFAIPPPMEADSDRRDVAQKVVHAVTEATVESLKEAGYPAEPMPEQVDPGSLEPAFRAVIVSGRFDEIDEGSVIGRVLIGFGLGATRLRSTVDVALRNDGSQEPFFDCEIDAHGSRMPGLIVPLGLASEIGLLVNGAMKAAGELKGPLAGDARRTGEKLAERLVEVFQHLGWTKGPPVWGD